ncbi:MAG: hypothetical protein R3D81_11045 [Thalassovita sp.]
MPVILVSIKSAGPSIERSTCDSAAKCITISGLVGGESCIQHSAIGYRPAERHKAGYLSWALVEQNVARVLYRMATFNRILTLGLGTGAFISAPLYILQTDGMRMVGSEIAAFIRSGYTAPSHTRYFDNIFDDIVFCRGQPDYSRARASVGAIFRWRQPCRHGGEALAEGARAGISRCALFNQVPALRCSTTMPFVRPARRVCALLAARALALRSSRGRLPSLSCRARWSLCSMVSSNPRDISPNYYVARFRRLVERMDEVLSGMPKGFAADRRQPLIQYAAEEAIAARIDADLVTGATARRSRII